MSSETSDRGIPKPQSEDVDLSRQVVKTTVPAYQKEMWEDDADALGMSSLAEFVRCMVQAGRRGFEEWDKDDGRHLRRDIETAIDDLGVVSFDEFTYLLDEPPDDIQDALDFLQRSDRVRYSGLEGGYVAVDESGSDALAAASPK